MPHQFPDGAVFYRKLRHDFPLAVRAEGSWIEDEVGRRWLDASGGAVVANLGHGGPLAAEIADAVAEEIRTLGYINASQFTHRAVEELASELVALTPGDLDFAYFLASGSEAVEAGVKLARQAQVESGRPG